MRLALEFRGVPEAPDRTPLLIGCSMAVIPGAMLLLAAFTGHMGDETPTTVQGWFTMAAAAAGMGAAFAAFGAFVTFLFRRLQVGLAAGHLVRVDADGLEIRYRGRTWRGPWGAIALDWREDDEGSKYLVFCAPSGRMEYPYLLGEVDHADLFAILDVKLRGALGPVWYNRDLGSQAWQLGKEEDPARAEVLGRRLVEDAEAIPSHRFGMLPVLEAARDAMLRVGLPERARELEERAERLRSELR